MLSGDLRGYRAYRTDEGRNALLLATLSCGISEYVDSTVEDADFVRIVLVGRTTQVVVEMTIMASMRIESELDRRRRGSS